MPPLRLIAPLGGVALARAKLVAGIVLILLYALLTPWLGFALATAAFVAGFLVLWGMRSLPAIAANVVIGTIGLLYLFVKVVYLPLPKGDGPFEALTLVLYLRLF